jgi:hypothetical protein
LGMVQVQHCAVCLRTNAHSEDCSLLFSFGFKRASRRLFLHLALISSKSKR